MYSPCWGRGTLRAAGPGQGHPQRDPQRLALLRYTEPSEISKQIFCEKIFAKLKTKKLLSKKIEIISTPLPPPPVPPERNIPHTLARAHPPHARTHITLMYRESWA